MHEQYTIKIAIAKALLKLGIGTIPILYKDKIPHTAVILRTCSSPAISQFDDHLPDEDDIEAWFSVPLINIGILMTNGIGVIDFDEVTAFNLWYRAWGKDLNLPIAQTARGRHVYFYHEGVTAGKLAYQNGEIIGDVKTSGYVVAPPSVHHSGKQYRWIGSSPSRFINIKKRPFSFEEVVGPLFTYPAADYSQNDMLTSPWDAGAAHVTDYIKPVKTNGKYAQAFCPFHQDNHPSFWINLNKNTWGCWTCGYSHEPVDKLVFLLNSRQKV